MQLDVKYIAELARLELSPEEAELFARQMPQIVGYVEKIRELDVEGVEPTMHGQKLVNVFREDVVRPSLDHETALANAPARHNDEFKLPKIVEGAES